MNILKLLAMLLISLVLSACASSRSGDVYSRDQTMREMVVRSGIVESVREVSMEGTQSGAGTLAGAAVGGVAGSTVGGGRGQIVGAIIGAVLGGIAGNSIEENATKKNALEMGEVFHPGERVRVLSGNGSTRVTH